MRSLCGVCEGKPKRQSARERDENRKEEQERERERVFT